MRTKNKPMAMLALATLGFAVNFWAWALLSPLGPRLKDSLHLSAFSQALVVAVPVVVGSLGRIPVVALTDRYGGRVMFPVVSFLTIVPVLFLGSLGHSTMAGLLVGGFFLGIAGTSFAVGVPLVNAWFPPDAPGRVVPAEPFLRRVSATARLPITWRASLLYAVGFGGYVAFSVYLPTYLKNGYVLSQSNAAGTMAGFVLVAVVMRPIGGWLSDRLQPAPVLVTAFVVVAVGAFVQSGTPTLSPTGTIPFLAMAAAIGAASGAVFALVAQQAPAHTVAAVAGLVGAAGGLGGFVPPLAMGSIYGHQGSHGLGLVALAVVALLALALAVETGRHRADALQDGLAGV